MTSAPLARALVPIAGLMLLFGAAGCASVGAEAFDDEGEVSLLKVDTPLREPTWVGPENTLLALKADEPKVVKIDTGAEVPAGEAPPASDEGAVVASERLESAGENFATYLRKPEQVYVPQPEPGRVAVLNEVDLSVEGALELGDAPPVEAST